MSTARQQILDPVDAHEPFDLSADDVRPPHRFVRRVNNED